MGGGRKVGSRREWAFAASAVCVALLCSFAFFAVMPDLKSRALPESSLSAFAEVRFEQPTGDALSVGVEELSDFSPLFLPTRWNYGRRPPSLSQEGLAEPGAARPAYAAALGDSSLILGKNELEAARTGLFRSIMRSSFSSFGRKDAAEPPARKNALIKVVDMSSGRTVVSEYADARTAEIMISPAEFLVDVFDGGVVGRPLLLKSSGSEASDSEIAEFIAKKAVLRGLGWDVPIPENVSQLRALPFKKTYSNDKRFETEKILRLLSFFDYGFFNPENGRIDRIRPWVDVEADLINRSVNRAFDYWMDQDKYIERTKVYVQNRPRKEELLRRLVEQTMQL